MVNINMYDRVEIHVDVDHPRYNYNDLRLEEEAYNPNEEGQHAFQSLSPD